MAQITLTLDFTPENVEALCKLAEVLKIEAPTKTPEKPPAKTGAAKPKAGAAKKEEKKTQPPADEQLGDAEATTITEVRAVALKLSKSGKQALLQEIFAKFGAKNLSDISQADYPALMEELEAVVNG